MLRVFFLCGAVFLSACAIERRGINPPLNDLYWPGGITVHPNGRYAYIVNINLDQRYNAGHVSIVDLDQLDGSTPYNQHAILGAKRTMSYGGRAVFNRDASRLFLQTREEAMLHHFEVGDDGASLHCGEKGARHNIDCDAAHNFQVAGEIFSDELKDILLDDPYDAVVTEGVNGLPGEYLFVSHLSAGVVSVYDITPNALNNPNGFAAAGLLEAPVNGTSALAVSSSPGRRSFIYAGSNRLIVRNPVSSTLMFFEPRFALSGEGIAGVISVGSVVPSTIGGGNDIKGIVTSTDGRRAYVLLRDPDALLVWNTELDENGSPRNQLIQVVALQQKPANLLLVSGAGQPGRRDMLYVSSYADNGITIYDAETLAVIGKIGFVTTNPFALAVAYRPTGPLVLASYITDDAVYAIDASSDNAADHTVFARIGSPRSAKP